MCPFLLRATAKHWMIDMIVEIGNDAMELETGK